MSIDGPSYNNAVDSNENQPILLASVDHISPNKLREFKARYVIKTPEHPRNVPDLSDKGKDMYQLMQDLESSICKTNKDCEKNAEKILDSIKDYNGKQAAADLMDFCLRVLYYYRHFDKFEPGQEDSIKDVLNQKIRATQREVENNPRYSKEAAKEVSKVKRQVNVIVDNFFNNAKKVTNAAIATTVAGTLATNVAFADVNKSPHEIGIVNNNGDIGINAKLNAGASDFYLQGQTDPDNFGNDWGVAGAYTLGNKGGGGGLGFGYSEKEGKGNIKAASLGGYANIGDKFYLNTRLTAKDFSPEAISNYAESKEYKALVGAGVNLLDDKLNINGGCGYASLDVEGYDKENNTVCTGGVNYRLPQGMDIFGIQVLPSDTNIGATYEDNGRNDKYMVQIRIPLGGGGSKKSYDYAKHNLGYDMMNDMAAFDDTLVKTKAPESIPEVVDGAPTAASFSTAAGGNNYAALSFASQVADAEDADSSLTLTVKSVPANGAVIKGGSIVGGEVVGGTTLGVNDTFTTADTIRYNVTDGSAYAGSDSFTYSAKDTSNNESTTATATITGIVDS